LPDASIATAAGADDAVVIERAIDGAIVVVDALFGVGLSRPVDEPYPRWIALVNAARAVRVAADVPSGLDADDGAPRPVAVRAHVTAAMGFAKRGCVAPSPGAAYCGRVVEVDIGLPPAVHRRFLAASG
jgi:NAD(P)H-hydrate epimerase